MEQVFADSLIDFDDITRSSRSLRREPFDRRALDWLKDDLITCHKCYFKLQGRVGLHQKLYSKLGAPHINTLFFRLKESVGGYARGGQEHQALSHIAALFLRDRGKEVQFEYPYNGRRCDVVSTDFEWVIECGDTYIDTVLEHLDGECNYYCILPFQEVLDGKLFMYVFRRGSAWTKTTRREVRDAEFQILHQSIKSKLDYDPLGDPSLWPQLPDW